MAGNFVAAPWMDGCSLARVHCVLAAGLWPYLVVRGIKLEAVAVAPFSSFAVGDCWRRAFFLWTPFCGVCTVRAVGRRILLLVRPLTALRRRVCLLASIGVRLAVFLLPCCVLTRGRNGADGLWHVSLSFF
ncbi:hypothetical protein TcG_10498 [Trypanosoma cruzi]|nr:hypothetical protein TcG_10498 [Trypanosoma cruzi]